MSLSYEPLTPVCVYDPRVMINEHRSYAILKCGSQTTWKAFTTTSVSSSSIQFSCPPPSGNVIVDRIVYIYIPVRLTFTGVSTASGQTLLLPERDAPRAFPIASAIDTLAATINNQSVNINIGDIVHALMHFNTDDDLKNRAYSMTPTYQDQSQNYGDLILGARNPLGYYGDSPDGAQMGRGGFPFTIVQNPVSTGSGQTLTAIVDVAFCEPLFLSPFYFGKTNGCGFYNINTMDFNFTFVGGQNLASRMWSHNDQSAGTLPIVTASAVFGSLAGGPSSPLPGGLQPQMLFQYITPQETMILPTNMPITYPYFDTIRFPTDLPQSTSSVPTQYSSNNIQLNSVPRRMYIYIRQRNSDLQSNPRYTDTFFQISQMSIQFLNSSGLLASAVINNLYDLSRRNHCQMSWTQWSGGPVQGQNFSGTIGTIGSVVCIEFARDIGLPSLMAPGILSQCQVQITVTASNLSGNTINPTLYIVPILEGTFSVVSMGACSTQIGVISPSDILDCHQQGAINYADVEEVNGGDFWSGLKEFGAKLLPYLEKAHGFIKKHGLVSKGLSYIPHPVAQTASKAAQFLGYGEGEGDGVMVGGKTLHRRALHQRLSRY
jgi:hypothetical protein